MLYLLANVMFGNGINFCHAEVEFVFFRTTFLIAAIFVVVVLGSRPLLALVCQRWLRPRACEKGMCKSSVVLHGKPQSRAPSLIAPDRIGDVVTMRFASQRCVKTALPKHAHPLLCNDFRDRQELLRNLEAPKPNTHIFTQTVVAATIYSRIFQRQASFEKTRFYILSILA